MHQGSRRCSAAAAAAQFTAVLSGLGVRVKPFVLNYTTPASDIILAVMAAEAAANFDYWQRSGVEDTNRRQDFWPPLLRLARMIPRRGIHPGAAHCLFGHGHARSQVLQQKPCGRSPQTPLQPDTRGPACVVQAQRARTQLLQEVVGLMQAAGIDAFIGNTSEELAMANLASLPTVVSCCTLGAHPACQGTCSRGRR